jgi:hypothetical protein
MIRWFRKRKLKSLKKKLLDLEWSYPPKTYSFDESQIVMQGLEIRKRNLKSQIQKLEVII